MYRTAVWRVLVMVFLSYSLFIIVPGCGGGVGGIEGDSVPYIPSGNSISLAWQTPERNSDGSVFDDLAVVTSSIYMHRVTPFHHRCDYNDEVCLSDGETHRNSMGRLLPINFFAFTS